MNDSAVIHNWPRIGEDVRVVWHDPDRGGMPAITYGSLGVEVDDEGRVTALVIEGDGSATRISRASLFSVDPDRAEPLID